MKRFLKKLRKGVKTACLTATLVTCWHVGQPAKASPIPPPDTVIRFSGTVSPTVNDVSHLCLIYGTGFSASGTTERLGVKLGDFPGGETTPFSVIASAYSDGDVIYRYGYALGLYGDISGGEYAEGVNGVTIGSYLSDLEGSSWDDFFGSHDEGTVFSFLLNDDYESLSSTVSTSTFSLYTTPRDVFLYDLSEASQGGEMQIVYEIIPEPTTVLFVGAGVAGVLSFRRRRT